MKNQRDMIRTQETVDRYRKVQAKRNNQETFVFDLEKETVVQEFTHWVIIKNDFPYDVVLDRHDMVVPRRFFSDPSEMNSQEREELEEIKTKIVGDYDGLFENLRHKRSVPAHFHIHLFLWKHIEDKPGEYEE